MGGKLYTAPVGTSPWNMGEWVEIGTWVEIEDADGVWDNAQHTLRDFTGSMTFDLEHVNYAMVYDLCDPGWRKRSAMHAAYRAKTRRRNRRRTR